MNDPAASCHVGLIGLGVMGRNLALNLADHGYRVAVHNRTSSVTDAFVAEHGAAPFPGEGGLVPCREVADLVRAVRSPRVVIVLVKSGRPVDLVCSSLLDAGLAADDVVVDAGNSRWTDTIRRVREYEGRLVLFGSGVSGGEVGARFGPSLMPGGDPEAWERLRPTWEAIAAKVDPETGRPLEGAAPQRPIEGGEPCTAYVGTDGAGHYVKMVHNGIEYADMQLICEAYELLRRAGAEPEAIADVFTGWNEGPLESYLVEITADILRQRDPETGRPMVDVVLDRAGQKGTGAWTAANALELGVPASTIAEAVFARGLSALKDERVAASRVLAGPDGAAVPPLDELVPQVHDALHASKICAYAQGFQLMRAAQDEHGWALRFADIARLWRGGCIIRARLLRAITDAFERDPGLTSLLLDDAFRAALAGAQDGWRAVVAHAARAGVACPAFASALAHYDGARTETLPASLLQAQRDYFGAHTFERVDRPRGQRYHLEWSEPERVLVEAAED